MKLGVLMVAIIAPFLTTQYQAFIRPLPLPIRESICFFVKPKKWNVENHIGEIFLNERLRTIRKAAIWLTLKRLLSEATMADVPKPKMLGGFESVLTFLRV